MALLLARAVCSMLLAWAAIRTAVGFQSSCLTASSSPADTIRFTECNNKTLNFTWSLDIQPPLDFEFVTFEYNCINQSNVTGSSYLADYLRNDGRRGSAVFAPVPGAKCLISACYKDSASSFHYISPTGCTLLPSTSRGDATAMTMDTSDFTYQQSIALLQTASTSATDPLISTSLPVHIKGVNVNLTVGVTIGVISFAIISVCALTLTSIICLARAVKNKAYQRELKQIGTETAQEIDLNYVPVDVQSSLAHVLHAASSEFSVLDDLEWLPQHGVDSNETIVYDDCFDTREPDNPDCPDVQTSVVDICTVASMQEEHSSAPSGHKVNNESFETMNSGFSLNSNGYCAFKR